MEPILFDFVYAHENGKFIGAVGAKLLTVEKSEIVIKKLSPAFSEKEIRNIIPIFYDLNREPVEFTEYDFRGYELKKFLPDAYILEPTGEGRREYLDTLPSIFLGHEDIYFIKMFENIK